MQRLRIERVDVREKDIAVQIHAVQQAAYAQEAQLLGYREVLDFPPMRRGVEALQRSAERFTAAFLNNTNTLVGCISIELPHLANWSGQKLDTHHIASLAVSPSHQRHGVASALVRSIVDEYSNFPITVSTALNNMPALSLYAGLGFCEIAEREIAFPTPPYKLTLALLRRE